MEPKELLAHVASAIAVTSKADGIIWATLLAILVEKGLFTVADVDELLAKLDFIADAEVPADDHQSREQLLILRGTVKGLRQLLGRS